VCPTMAEIAQEHTDSSQDAQASSAVHEGEESADDVGQAGSCTVDVPAADLKALGNEAYQKQDVQTAVDLWNKALRKHVDEMQNDEGLSPLSPECQALERSLYLNLAQGYLKLGEPGKALRACQVVLMDNKTDPKACYRAAEACLALNKEDEAETCLNRLLEADPAHTEAKRLLQKMKAQQRVEKQKQKDVAKKMCAGASGFAEDRPVAAPAIRDSAAHRLATIENMANGPALAQGLALGDMAAKAAQDREKRMAAQAEGPLPEPSVMDFDAFRAKALGRSKKYSAFIDKNKKKQDVAKRSVKLAWLRTGQESGAFNSFEGSLKDELREIEETDMKAAQLGDDVEDDGKKQSSQDGVDGQSPDPEAVESSGVADDAGGAMEKMD